MSASESSSISQSTSPSLSASTSASQSASSSESSSESSETTYMLLTVGLDRLDVPDETILQADTVTIGGARQGGAITVSTVEREIQIHSSIVIPGLLYLRNYSDTIGQYVEIGYLSGATSHRIYNGEAGLIPLHPNERSIFLRANSGTIKLEYEITERVGV